MDVSSRENGTLRVPCEERCFVFTVLALPTVLAARGSVPHAGRSAGVRLQPGEQT